jgi:uncharacterized membrane protein YfcA
MEAYATWLPVIAALVAAGAAGGLIAGLLGVGGGIVLVPALDLALGAAGVDPAVSLHVAVATSMATIVPTAISSSRAHASRNAVDFAVVKRWAIPIVVGALGGWLAGAHVLGNVLAAVFGTVALLSALKMLLPLDRVVLRPSLPEGIVGALIPAFIGAISATMGIGGGTLSVPTMTLCGEPVHKAVGTAALLGLWIAVPATLGYLLARPAEAAALPPRRSASWSASRWLRPSWLVTVGANSHTHLIGGSCPRPLALFCYSSRRGFIGPVVTRVRQLLPARVACGSPQPVQRPNRSLGKP